MINVFQYFQNKKLEFTEDSTKNEYILKVCPLCFDQNNHCYVAKDKGLFHCKKCNESGNFITLQRALGDEPSITPINVNPKTTEQLAKLIDKYHNALLVTPSAQKYLNDRGITEKSIKEFKLGYDNDWITIPHIIDNKPISIKYRKLSQKEFKRYPGTPSVLFNLDNLDKSLDQIVITEGEFDAIKGHQEGIKNIVAVTVGAASFQKQWVSIFKEFKKVYLCFDSDISGQRGAQKTAEVLGLDKCYNIILNEKDLNDFLNKYSLEELKTYFEKATRFEIAEITSLATSIDNFDEWLKNLGECRGLKTGFDDLDEILQGLKNEDLIILSGASTVGKTSFALNMILSLLKEDKKILAFLLEGRLFYFIEKLMSIELDRPMSEVDEVTIKEMKEKLRQFSLYFYSGPQSTLDTTKVVEKVTSCKKLYGIDLLVLDHLHKVVERGKDNYSALVGKAVSDLKNLAVDLKIPVIVITHIRKQSKPNTVPNMQDLRDSSFIHQDSDVILMMWADLDNPATRDNVILKVLKNKTGQDSVDLFYKFNRPTGRFNQLKKNDEI